MRAAKLPVLFVNFTPMSTLRAPRRPHLARAMCGAAAIALTLSATLAAPLSAQTVIDYTNGQTRNVGVYVVGAGDLTLNTAAGVTATDASFFAGASGAVTKTGAGRLSITSDNSGTYSGGRGGWTWTTLRVAEGTLDIAASAVGASSFTSLGYWTGKTIQIDSGARLVTSVQDASILGNYNVAGTLALAGGGTMSGNLTSTVSGHIGAHIAASDTTSTATNRAVANGFAVLFVTNGHRLNMSGTSSDVMFNLGSDGTSGGNTIALNGAVLGAVINRTGRGLAYGDLQALRLTTTTDTALIEADSQVASIQSKGTVDLGGNKLTLFDDQPAISGNVVASEIGMAGVGVLKGSAASVLRKTGQSKLSFNLADASEFLGAVEVAGGIVTISAAMLADDNTLTITSEGGRTGRVNIAANDRVGAIIGDAGQLDIAATKTLQVGGTATDRGVNTFAGVLSGAGNLEFMGTHNTTVLTGTNTLSGSVAVNAGKLLVNGTLPAAISVGSGGTLGGSGTAGAVTVASGGTLAAGNSAGSSVGTLNTGAVTLAAGSTLLVEVDESAADLINATGAVGLAGSNLHVAATAGNPTLGQVHTIVSATGGVTGTFDSVVDDYAFFDSAVTYDANSVKLQFNRNSVSLASVASTSNQNATADALDSLATSSDLVTEVMGLSSQQAQAAYDNLSGEIHADVQGSAVEGALGQGTAVLGHLAQVAGQPAAQNGGRSSAGAGGNGITLSTRGAGNDPAAAPRFWGGLSGQYHTQTRSDGFAAVNGSAFGITAGMDFAADGPWTTGAVLGALHTTADMSDRSSTARSNSISLGLYGGRSYGDFGLGFGLLHDHGTTRASRTVSVGGTTQTLSSRYKVDTTLAFAEVNTQIDASFGQLTPFLRLSQARVVSGGFTETGGSAALTRDTQTSTATIAEIGLRGAKDLKLFGKDARLSGGISYQSAIAGGIGKSLHGFAQGGDAFSVAAGVSEGEAIAVDLGLNVALSDRANLDVTYSGARAGKVDDHNLGLTLSVKF